MLLCLHVYIYREIPAFSKIIINTLANEAIVCQVHLHIHTGLLHGLCVPTDHSLSQYTSTCIYTYQIANATATSLALQHLCFVVVVVGARLFWIGRLQNN